MGHGVSGRRCAYRYPLGLRCPRAKHWDGYCHRHDRKYPWGSEPSPSERRELRRRERRKRETVK